MFTHYKTYRVLFFFCGSLRGKYKFPIPISRVFVVQRWAYSQIIDLWLFSAYITILLSAVWFSGSQIIFTKNYDCK
jgi:hypothetical protein